MDTNFTVTRHELLQVADAVAREKSIERDEVLEAMEQAIQKAGRAKYGHEHDIRAHLTQPDFKGLLGWVALELGELEGGHAACWVVEVTEIANGAASCRWRDSATLKGRPGRLCTKNRVRSRM